MITTHFCLVEIINKIYQKHFFIYYLGLCTILCNIFKGNASMKLFAELMQFDYFLFFILRSNVSNTVEILKNYNADLLQKYSTQLRCSLKPMIRMKKDKIMVSKTMNNNHRKWCNTEVKPSQVNLDEKQSTKSYYFIRLFISGITCIGYSPCAYLCHIRLEWWTLFRRGVERRGDMVNLKV